jgi:transcriptional regulator with XRE-family HTH domain
VFVPSFHFAEVKKRFPRKYYIDQPFVDAVGNKIREIRLSKNISQETLANGCDMDYSQVNRMELGKANFSISHLKRIALALGVDPGRLLPTLEEIS